MAKGSGAGFWRKAALVFGVLVAVLVGAGFVASMMFPAERVKSDAERMLSEQLKRDVSVGGARLSFFPVLGAELTDVAIDNVEGGTAPKLLTAEGLVVGVAVRPLLQGQVEVTRLFLRKPVIALEKGADGQVNWKLGDPQQPDQPRALPEWMKDLSLRAFGVRDGEISMLDRATGKRTSAGDVDADLRLESLDKPAELNAALTYRGRRVRTEGTVGSPRSLFLAEPTPLAFSLKADPVTAAFDGRFSPAEGILEGAVDASGASLKRLLGWLGEPQKEGRGLGAFSVKGQIRRQGEEIRLSRARVSIDHIRATGDVTLRLGGARPYASGRLDLGALDVNPWLASDSDAPAEGVDVRQGGWSTKPLDFGGLRAIDADLEVRASSLAVQRMKLGAASLGLSLRNGAADVAVRSLSAYGGSGSGRVRLSQGPAGATVGGALTFSGVQAKPFLTDAVGLEKLEGALRLELQLAGTGANQAALMRDLDGAMAFRVENGSWRGVDLARVAKEVQSVLTGQAVGPSAKTDFSEFAADFTVRDGVANTDNLRLINPTVRMDGVGKIDIGAQSLDFSLDPKSVRGASTEARSVGVPFRVWGPWSKVRYAPDLSKVAEQALRKELSERLGVDPNASAQDLLGSLFGRKKSDAPAGEPAPEGEAPAEETPPPPEEKSDPLRDLLKRFPGG